MLYSDCLRRESKLLASTRPVNVLCVSVCCIVGMCDCIMVIHQSTCNLHTCTKQSPDTLKPKCYSLVEGNLSIVHELFMDGSRPIQNAIEANQRCMMALNNIHIARKWNKLAKRNERKGRPLSIKHSAILLLALTFSRL